MTAQPIPITEIYGDGISALEQELQRPLLTLVQSNDSSFENSDYNPILRLVGSDEELEEKLPENVVAYEAMGEEVQADLDILKLEDPEAYIRVKKGDTNIVDAQTELFTKYFFEKDLVPYLMEKAQEEGTTVSIIYMDIDKFHDFNDTYGHQAGDDGIAYVVDKLDHNIRTHDTIIGAEKRAKDLRGARVGCGEEFAVALYGVNEEQAYQVAERMRISIYDDEILSEGQLLKTTASFGVAEMVNGESAKELLTRADKSTFASKDNGRNKVTMYSQLPVNTY